MEAQREQFVEGRRTTRFRGRRRLRSSTDGEFAEYGFNKSHSAAYALLAYQTAYLKANYPAHFMAALLTSEKDHAKIAQYIHECRNMVSKSFLRHQPER